MSATLLPLGDDPNAASESEARVTPASSLDTDVVIAVRNALKLGAALIGTWGIGLLVRVMLPRLLGPSMFGTYQFADAFTSGLFVLAGLGTETYVRKEVATRREHAAEFYGGVLLLRVVLGIVLIAGGVAALSLLGKPTAVLQVVLIFALTQFFVVQNATLAALLHAVGRVDGLSYLSVASKALWGGGSVVALLMGGGLLSVGVAMLVSEILKTIALEVLARRHLRLPARIDAKATRAVLAGSLPYFVGGLSQAFAGRVNVTIMAFLVTDLELGWYSAGWSIAMIAMTLEPLLRWVLLPLNARAESRSVDELAVLTRRAMRLVLTVTVPIALFLGVWADLIVRVLFGPSFAPTTLTLRAIAPCFVLGYVAIVSSGALIGLGRGWTVTAVSFVSLVLSVLLNWSIIPRAFALIGPGGAGVGAGIVLVLTELVSAGWLTVALGGRAFDRDGLRMLGRMLAVCAVVIAVDRVALGSLGLARVPIEIALYLLLALAWHAGDHEVLLSAGKRILSRRRRPHVAVA